ncbi:MAG: hypothetical protein Q9170_006776 [Blastenia crenularia]
MATGMPAWVTRTLEYLTHPRDASTRPTIGQSQPPERFTPTQRRPSPKVRVGAERRRNKARQTRLPAHSPRFPIKVSNIQAQEIVQTYENRSTQTDETTFPSAGHSIPKEDPPNSIPRDSRQGGDPFRPRHNETVQILHLTDLAHDNGHTPEQFLEPLVNSTGGSTAQHPSEKGLADEDMYLEDPNAPDSVYNGQEPVMAEQEEEMSEGPPYTGGEAQIVLANDGMKDCLALLLTSEMVAKINQISTRARRLDFITSKLKHVKREISSEENMAEYKTDALRDTDDQAEVARINEDIDEIQLLIAENMKCIGTLEEEIDTLTVNLAFSREQSQEIFEEALRRMDLLDVPEPEFAKEADPVDGFDNDAESISEEGGIEPGEPHHDKDTPGSAKFNEVNRRAAKDDFEHRRNVLIIMDEAFEHRQENLAEEKAEYRRRVREGTCHITETDFDLLALEDFRRMTADLRVAEEAFEESFKRAKQLGVLDERDAHYQESDFSEWSGGYPLSFENAMAVSAPTDSIIGWRRDVEETPARNVWGGTELEPWGNPNLEPATRAMEDCDVRSVAISDSWSCVDWSRNRSRIDRWREIAGRER